MKILSNVFRRIPNLPYFVVNNTRKLVELEWSVYFESRFIKEVLRERLEIDSFSWDFKKTREICTLLGEKFLPKKVICEHLSSMLINNFIIIYSFMLNNPDEFLDFTMYRMQKILMPKILYDILKMALVHFHKPKRIEKEIVSFYFTKITNKTVTMKDKIGFPKSKFVLQDVLGEVSTYKVSTENYPFYNRSQFIEALLNITQASEVFFSSCSVSISNYEEFTQCDERLFMSCILKNKLNLLEDEVIIYSNDTLTEEELYTTILSGIYYPNLETTSNIYSLNSIPLSLPLLLERLREYLESAFSLTTVSTSNRDKWRRSAKQKEEIAEKDVKLDVQK